MREAPPFKQSGVLSQHIPHGKTFFVGLIAILLLSGGIAVWKQELWPLILAPLALGLYLTISDFRFVFFLMWAAIPLSTELEFSGGLGLDFPAELLMIVLSGVTLLWCLHRLNRASLAFLVHPVTLLLFLHLGWIACTTITSSGQLVSVKFLLAKIWYVVPFYVLSYLILRREKDIRLWLLCVLFPLAVTVVVVLVRHAGTGFSFEDVNYMLKPFYRNHVDYGLILGVIFPFVALLGPRWLPRSFAWGLIFLLLVALYFTYTRAAYVGLVIAIGGILLVRWKLSRYAIVLSFLVIGVTLLFLSRNNRYIDYAPDYYRAITHQKFGNLLEATYKLEDISTVERFYRWIAAFYMVQEKPVTGFGPNNFVEFYKGYTDEHYMTYVSDNPEKSGVHNYFLMTAVEQGLPGLIIFIALLFIAVLRAEWLYHRLKKGFYKQLLTAVIGSVYFILFALLLNDMIETDKVGSFFFINLAFLVIIERNARKAGEMHPVPQRAGERTH